MLISSPRGSIPLMCWSTGRCPIAQPPGRLTRASPKRATSGPRTRMEARMVLTRSYGASRQVISDASSSTWSLSPLRYFTPSLSKRRSVVPISRRRGTFSNVNFSAVSRLAHKMGRAAFLAPDMATSPCKGRPPRMRSLSIRFSLIFGGRQGAHGQRMNFRLHAIAQRGVYQLMAGDTALALKSGADDQRFKVRTVPHDVEHFAFKVISDVLAYKFRSGQHESIPKFVPPRQQAQGKDGQDNEYETHNSQAMPWR